MADTIHSDLNAVLYSVINPVLDSSLCARRSCQIASRPGVLEIEAAGDAVDVEDFAREVKAWALAAFHRLEVDFRKLHAAAGHELVLEHALAVDLELRGRELASQGLQRGVADVGPRGGGRMPAAMTKRSQRRWGMATGLKVVTCLRAFCSRTTERALIKVSRVWGGVQLSEIGNA